MTCSFLGLQQGQNALLCLDLEHIAGIMMVVRALKWGLTLYCVEPSSHPLRKKQTLWRITANGMLEQANEWPRSLHFVAMVATQVVQSLSIEEEAQQLRTIRHLIIGGGAVEDALQQQLFSFPHAVWSTYGMTETLSHIALRRLNGSTSSTWYIPLQGVRVWREADGCLSLHAPAVHPSPLHTRDLVEMRSDGSFRVLGRADNVVISGGLKIQIEEVEALLRPVLSTPFLVTRAPHSVWGQQVVLLTENQDTETVMSLCAKVLPHRWMPKTCLHVSSLPLTATGKPARATAEKWATQACKAGNGASEQ